MTTPRRVRVQGDLYHGQVPEDAVYVGRQAPGLRRSPFANPYSIKEHGREGALRLYRQLLEDSDLLDRARAELTGRDLACWCPLDQQCHADILLDLVNGPSR
jgi:hypothetical protein